MVIIDDGARLDVDVNTLVSEETWDDGIEPTILRK